MRDSALLVSALHVVFIPHIGFAPHSRNRIGNSLTKDLQLASPPHAHSAWQRWLVVASILLLLFASVGQAAHTHEGSTVIQPSHSAARFTVPHIGADEIPCPLCNFFHSSLPAQAPLLFALLLPMAHLRRRNEKSSTVSRSWDFHLFSRPPPFCS